MLKRLVTSDKGNKKMQKKMQNNSQKINIRNFHIPSTLNLLLAFISMIFAIICLWFAEKSFGTFKMIFPIIFFAFINNTLFSLFHESVHGVFHENRKFNDFFGRLLAFFFPTSFSLQQIYHLGHHRRNRTDDEMFDYHYENEPKWPKKMTIFGLMTGLYWSSAFFSCLLFTFFPWIFNNKKFVHSFLNKTFKFEAMLSGANKKTTPRFEIMIETVFMLIFWMVIFYFLDLSFLTWLLCYMAFGVNWGSLQYTDHAFTPRDIRNGAWNLKIHPIIRLIFLNYHYHQVHHQYPNLSWIHLPKFVDDSNLQSFWEIYWRLWRGPELTLEPNPVLKDHDFEKSIYDRTRYE